MTTPYEGHVRGLSVMHHLWPLCLRGLLLWLPLAPHDYLLHGVTLSLQKGQHNRGLSQNGYGLSLSLSLSLSLPCARVRAVHAVTASARSRV